MSVTTTSEAKATDGRRRRRSVARFLMETTGTEWCGNDNPPMSHHVLYVHDDGVTRVFSMQDDGGSVGIGYPDEWHVIMRRKAAQMFAWWMFKLWIKNWFGLRERIYYSALHRHVRGVWKVRPHRHRKHVWKSSHDEWRKSGVRV